MKLWDLRSIPGLENDNPWEPMYNKIMGFVVRAETEAAARRFAADKASDEGRVAWLDGTYSTCVELLPHGDAGVLMADFYPN